MVKLNKITLANVLQILLFFSLLISLYTLIINIYRRNYNIINYWQFPMLLALFLETIII
jgi:hypothetical protein